MHTDKIFADKVTNILEPFLSVRGFMRYYFDKKYLSPCFLYKNQNLWLGVSWDWRDLYFESSLGELYEIIDVVPTVIVYGHYELYLEVAGLLNSYAFDYNIPSSDIIENKCKIIVETLDRILSDYSNLSREVEKITKERLPLLKLVRKITL